MFSLVSSRREFETLPAHCRPNTNPPRLKVGYNEAGRDDLSRSSLMTDVIEKHRSIITEKMSQQDTWTQRHSSRINASKVLLAKLDGTDTHASTMSISTSQKSRTTGEEVAELLGVSITAVPESFPDLQRWVAAIVRVLLLRRCKGELGEEAEEIATLFGDLVAPPISAQIRKANQRFIRTRGSGITEFNCSLESREYIEEVFSMIQKIFRGKLSVSGVGAGRRIDRLTMDVIDELRVATGNVGEVNEWD
ncbi:hypothetical protein GMRT_13501 [Giardia muris]|uniref:Uncharacterized protein n=1 Tax=Giardia muris TaxID=5742 RepID=A0A4Z1SQA1_GIAMU|nr:hypothetical protein GMRT_13501 [Giardia muris]|eukprot:TNJ27986.1 hypothetical protein GMRT_13501 [Giardia muris]